MPNHLVVRSFRESGMRKFDDGGVPAQGVPANVNSTYPQFEPTPDPDKEPVDLAAVAPTNQEYKERLPTTIAPLGAVDLGPVNQIAKAGRASKANTVREKLS